MKFKFFSKGEKPTQPETVVEQKAMKPQNGTLQTLPEDNEIMRALMAFAMSNQVIHYKNDNSTFIDKGYCHNPHVYTIISWIGRNLSQVQFYPCIVKDKKAYENYIKLKSFGADRLVDSLIERSKALERIETGPLAAMFENPNPDQSWAEFMFEWSGYEEVTGNSYIYGLHPAGYDDDIFAGLYIPPSQLMQIVSGGWLDPVKGYRLMYSMTSGQDIEAEKILHMKNWNPTLNMQTGKSLYGLSPLSPLRRTLQRSNESVDGSLALLTNGNPGGVLSNDSNQTLVDPQRSQAQKDFDRLYGGGANLNKIILASSKVSWQQIGLSSVDLELLASDKIDFATICKAYGIDEIIFDPDKSNYNNKTNAQKDVWLNTLIPKLNQKKQGLTRWLCPGWSNELRANVVIDYDISNIACLQADLKTQIERLNIEFGMGMHSPNDLRIAQGLEPKKDALLDKHYLDNKYHELGTENKNPYVKP